MKIEIAGISLNADGQEPKDFLISQRRQVQTEFPIGSERASIFDRKNTKTALSFKIERAHQSECDAEIFAASHGMQLSEASPANLNVSMENSRGEKAATFVFYDAIPEQISVSINGIASTTSYQFSSKKIERTYP